VALAASSALLVAVAVFTPTPAVGAPSAHSAAASIESVVVPSGGSASWRLGAIPTGATAAAVTFTTTGAWRSTAIRASLGEGTAPTVIVATDPATATHTVVMPVGARFDGTMTLASERASVRVSATAVTPSVKQVVPTGGAARFALPQSPTGATAVRATITTEGAWRATSLSVVGASTTAIAVSGAARATGTVTLPLATDGSVTLASTRASVAVTLSVLGWTTQASDQPVTEPTMPPTPTPTVPTPTVPAPTRPPSPAAAGFPSAESTGVPSGVRLTQHTGDLRVTTPGAIIEGLDVRGRILVEADNVTIRNSVVRGTAAGWTTSTGLIMNNTGRKNLVIVDSELTATVRNSSINGVFGANFSAERLDISNVVDSVRILGDNVSVTDSWMHDNIHLASDPLRAGTPTHDDSIQIEGGRNVTIARNSMSSAKNAAIQITQGQGIVGNVSVTGNFMDGGGCTVNVSQKGGGPISGMSLTDNTFGGASAIAGCAIISPPTSLLVTARNVYRDGSPVTVTRGS
jgi:hypothetical protein